MGSNPTGLRIHLTGTVRVEADSAVVDERRLPGRLGRLAFAYLAAAHDHPVPRDELAQVLWGDEPPPTWEKGTVVLISKLRAALGDLEAGGRDMLTNAYGCYQLNLPAGTWVDVTAAHDNVRRAEEALDAGDAVDAARLGGEAMVIARRPFLPGEDGAWVSSKRDEMRRLLVDALACSAEARLRLGEPQRAVAFAAEAVRAEPFRESGYVLLMRAHAAAGDRGEALRVHEECRRLLAEELGVDPSPATEAVHLAILRAVAVAEPETGTGVAVDEPRAVEPVLPDSNRPVVVNRRRGRQRAILSLAAAFAVVAAGALSAVVIARHSDNAPALVPAARTAARISATGTGFDMIAPVGDRPEGLAVDGSSVWVVDYSGRTLTRIDAGSGAVLRTEAVSGAPTGIVAAGRSVWITTAFGLSDGGQGSVQRFDAASGAPDRPLALGDGITGIAVTDDALWVTDQLSDALLHIDPLSHAIVATIPVGKAPSAVALSGGSAWVADGLDNNVVRVDLASRQVTATVSVPDPVAIAAAGNAVWVASAGQGTLTRIDAASGNTVATISVGSEPVGVAVASGAVWVAVAGAGKVVRVDPGSNGVTQALAVRGRPAAIAAAGGAVWVSVEGA